MLRAIEIENFKAFGKRQRIELAPITLIFGENSAGKSSILQALSLLKQSRRYGDDTTFLVPRIEGGYVDLGSFEELIFDHDQKKTLRFRLDFDGTVVGKRTTGSGIDAQISGVAEGKDSHGIKRDFDDVISGPNKSGIDSHRFGVELSFFRRSSRSPIELIDWCLHETAETQWRKLASFAPLAKSQVISRKHRTMRSDSDRTRKGECIWVIDRPEFWERVFASVSDIDTSCNLRPEETTESDAKRKLLLEMRQLEKRLQELTEQIAGYDAMLEGIEDQLNDLTYLLDQQQEVNDAERPSLVNARRELQLELPELESQYRLLDLEEAHIRVALTDPNISKDLTKELELEQNSLIERKNLLLSRQEDCGMRLVEIEEKLKSSEDRRSREEIQFDQEGLSENREVVLSERTAISVEIEDCVWLLERKESEYAAIQSLADTGPFFEETERDSHAAGSSVFGALGDITPAAFMAEAIERQKGETISFRGFAIVGRSKEIKIRGVALAEYGGDLLGKAIDASNDLQTMLRVLCPMGPFRSLPERWYVASGQITDNVGYGGARVPEFLFSNKDLVERTNSWLDRLMIGYHIKPRRIGVRPQDLFELRLIDTRRSNKTEVAIADVGFGISQILPFIVQSLVADNQIISIEQPEVHIHPRLQADLGDLLAEASAHPHNNQFIVETHSEHLVLRLQNLVRHGKLSSDDVAIIYVSRGEDGAKAERLRLDSDGDFIDEWPGGFFPERSREFQ